MKTICFNCRLQQYITEKDNGHTSFLFFSYLLSPKHTWIDRRIHAYTCARAHWKRQPVSSCKWHICLCGCVTFLYLATTLSGPLILSSDQKHLCVPFIKSRKDLSTLVSFLLIFLLLLVCVQIYMLLGFFVLLFCSICAWCLLGLHKLYD